MGIWMRPTSWLTRWTPGGGGVGVKMLFSCSPWNPGRLTRIGWFGYKRDDEILPQLCRDSFRKPSRLVVATQIFFFPSQFWGKWIQFDQYVSNGLKSPNRYICSTNWSSCCLTNMRMYPIWCFPCMDYFILYIYIYTSTKDILAKGR